ncbi:Uncharacterised protein [uncultured archaeon]|nr:Uncharacterised protein [uncultured archaeon]
MHEQAFQVDRVCFDRSIWTVYFPSVVKRSDQIRFDTDLVDRLNLEDRLKETFIKGRGREKVFYFEKGSAVAYAKYGLRLRGTRSLIVYFNFNRYFIEKNSYKHDIKCPVIHDDNFLPLESTVTLKDYLDVFNTILPGSLREIYLSLYSQFWPDDPAVINGEEPVIKPTTLEVAREMYPLDVQTVRTDLAVKGKHFEAGEYSPTKKPFKSYNDQSKMIYFGEAPEGLNMSIDGAELVTDVDCWNWRDEGDPKQGKLYQKSINLARFEVTLYGKQIEFGYSGQDDQEEGVKFILDGYAEDVGISFVPREVNYDQMVELQAKLLKLDKATIGMIFREGTYWPATRANHNLTKRLSRRGLIIKNQRGLWIVNPAFLKIFEKYIQPKGDDMVYIPKLL